MCLLPALQSGMQLWCAYSMPSREVARSCACCPGTKHTYNTATGWPTHTLAYPVKQHPAGIKSCYRADTRFPCVYCVDVQGLSSSLLEGNLVTLLSDQRIINIILQVRGGGFWVWQMMHPSKHGAVPLLRANLLHSGWSARYTLLLLPRPRLLKACWTDKPALQPPAAAAACTPDCCRVRS